MESSGGKEESSGPLRGLCLSTRTIKAARGRPETRAHDDDDGDDSGGCSCSVFVNAFVQTKGFLPFFS